MLRSLRVVGPLAFIACLRAGVPEFEPNLGQAETRFLYLARAGALRAYIENGAIEFRAGSAPPVRMSWANAAGEPAWSAADPTGNLSYYCNQPRPELCRQPVPGYGRLSRKDLYPNIDLALYGRESRFEYDLIVHPGARLEDVRLQIEPAPRLNPDGSIAAGGIVHWRPAAYQWVDGRRVEIAVSLQPRGSAEFGFVLGPHRSDLDLTIDPVIQTVGVAGGSGDDIMAGTSTTGSSCSWRYGITNSADWSNLPGPGHSVFVQLGRPGLGTVNVFWGGSGDSQVGGADTEPVNCRLYVVGWTSAQDAPTFSAPSDNLVSRPYAGGATDGFFLEFAWSGLAFASYVGGPGADRIYDVRRTAPAGSFGPFALAGQTDNSAWPQTVVQQIGPGGQTDAFAATLNGPQISMTVIGGSGNDRAMRLRAAGAGYWAIGGETDSPDFPSTGGTQSAAGKDLWIGRITSDVSTIAALALFGGSGDEQFGGLAWIGNRGLYLAGTTNSTDLPAAGNSFLGGASDGFIAALDPVTAATVASNYIGGSGRDEIAAMEPDGANLLLGGDTDSTDLVLPGLNQNPLGGLDALFVVSDSLGSPANGIRFGGSADDRIIGLESTGFGKVILSGGSQSQDWLQTLDPFAAGLGGQDGFAVSVSFADLAATPYINQQPVAGDLYLGRDLQAIVQIAAASEDGMDGMVVVRSSDPSRLLVSASTTLPGTDQILLTGVDTSYYPSSFTLQALADNGEVDVIVEGRSAASPNGAYPRQILHVQLAPTALFIGSTKDITVAAGNTAGVNFFQAPVLPGGSAGPAEDLRYGVTATPELSSSDNNGLPVVSGSPTALNGGTYLGSVKAVATGNYTVTPSNGLFAVAPGQTVTVHVVNQQPVTVFGGAKYYLVNDNVVYLGFGGGTGSSLVFTSDDPSRLLLGADASASSASVTLANGATLWLAALAGDGTVGLHVTGTYQGQTVSEVTQVRLVPYKAALSGVLATVGVGVTFYPSVTLTPQLTPDLAGWTALNGSPRPAAFANLQLQSSNPSVLQAQARGVQPLGFQFLAVQVGSATLSFGPSAPAVFAGLSATVQVNPATINFGVALIRIPVGASVNIYPGNSYATASTAALKAVRLRLSPGAPLTIQSNNGTGTDVTVDLSSGQFGVSLLSQNAQSGQQSTLYVSAPGVAEFPIPIHLVDPIFVPDTQEFRLVVGNPQGYGNSLSYHLAAYDAGQVYELGLSNQLNQPLTLYPSLNPSAICTAPSSVNSLGASLSVTLTCNAVGVTTLSLNPGPGVGSAQPQLSVRVVSQPAAAVPVPLSSRVFTGNGLQAELSMYLYTQSGSSGPFIGTLTSSDPDRVRLSTDRNAPGSASVTIPADRSVGSVFVQGYASDGIVTLNAQSSDGRTGQVTVYLFQSTLAVRPSGQFISASSDLSAVLSLDQPLSTPDFQVNVLPYLIDPGSSKLIWTSALSIRGGSDPVFARAQSSDTTVVQPVPPDAIVSEGDTAEVSNLHVNAVGDVVLSVSQPNGFVTVPDSSLKTHVFERGLAFGIPVVLSADLELAAPIVSPGAGYVGNVTATSLDPQKLLLSTSASAPGQASVVASSNGFIYVQALSGVQPGDSVGVRLEGAGYVTSQASVSFAAAELQTNGAVPLTLQPLTSTYLSLVYGPVDSTGHVAFNGTVRAGVTTTLQVSSSDTTILGIAQPTVPLNTYMNVPLRPLAPGHTQILVQAPPQITNRVAAVDVLVGPYQFSTPQMDYPSRYLVSKFTVNNPLAQSTAVTISSNGIVPVRLGTAAAGTGAPSAGPLAVTLNAGETRAVYLEPTGPGNSAQIQVTAANFAPATSSQSVWDPQVNFLQGGPLTVSLQGGAVTATVVLYGMLPTRELPLGTAYGPLNIQVQSSNPKVVSVPSAPVTFKAGDSRQSFLLQPVGTGDAVVSIIVPASFAGNAPTRQDMVVSVR